MSSFHQISAVTLSMIVVASPATPLVNTTTATVATTTYVGEAIAPTPIAGAMPTTQPTVFTGLLAQATRNLLSPVQKAQLTQLPIPVVAPTYLPAGFRLVRADGEAGSYANGDDDSGYAIDYQGNQNTCLSIRTSKDGPRGLAKVKQVQTRFGQVTVYTEKLRDSQSFVSYLGIKGNPVLISGGMQPDSKAAGGWKPCRAVSLDTYTQVLRSLAIVK
ncbi:MAG: hypothetical protein KME27_12295 [Lyngbya sp. HA4199-MV5]|jgi:hypothetical protein|nr:hypothetical protein [Lyngbya sp. HA4199-MV5]